MKGGVTVLSLFSLRLPIRILQYQWMLLLACRLCLEVVQNLPYFAPRWGTSSFKSGNHKLACCLLYVYMLHCILAYVYYWLVEREFLLVGKDVSL